MKVYSLNRLLPIELADLMRVGRNFDGGYVLCRKQIEKTTTLLSFGICDDWSFEADVLLHIPHTILHAYDYSVCKRIYANNILKYLFRCRYKAPIRNLKCLIGFNRFFNATKSRFFHKKYVGAENTITDVSVDEIFKCHLECAPQDLSVFVKMDIEGAEYKVLPLFEPYFQCINGFVIEFHALDVHSSIFEDTISMLQQYFNIAHAHANNAGGYIDGTSLPKILELTFINKRMVAENPTPSTRKYPVDGLDFPCIRKDVDIPLNFEVGILN